MIPNHPSPDREYLPDGAESATDRWRPTRARPGTDEKIRVLRSRVENKQPLWHPLDIHDPDQIKQLPPGWADPDLKSDPLSRLDCEDELIGPDDEEDVIADS
jgi:hypothetical protein